MRLIGFSGKDQLKEGFDQVLPDKQKVFDFIGQFRGAHGVGGPDVDPAVSLLRVSGMSSKIIAKETMAALIEIMKRQIARLEQEQLDAVLDKCYSYLTVPELAPVGIAVLERLHYVDPDIWAQIVGNGLDVSPYTDLPISIKRRIWASEPTAFDHEATDLVKRVSEPEAATSLENFIPTGERQRQRSENAMVKELLRLVHGSEDELVPRAIEKIVDAATEEQSSAKRIAIANLFHDFVIMLNVRNTQSDNLLALRKMAKFLDGGTDVSADQDQLQHIRDAISNPASRGPVALLVSSAYSRDYIADQLVGTLQSRRGPVGTGEDPNIIADATAHLHADPWIADLTYLCLCNMKSGPLLSEGVMPSDEEVDTPFQLFYPLLIGEMEADTVKFEDDYFTSNANLPNKRIDELVKKGWLERRVVTSYCLSLRVHGNIVGLSRFRLILDSCYSGGDSTAETRECQLAFFLLSNSVEEMYGARTA